MGKKPRVALKRGDVYLVSFDPTVGAKIKKIRPALVIQNDIGNRYSPVTIVAAITSQVDTTLYPTEVLLRAGEAGLTTNSAILLNQIRTVDKQRLVKRLGTATLPTMVRVDEAIQISLGLVDL